MRPLGWTDAVVFAVLVVFGFLTAGALGVLLVAITVAGVELLGHVFWGEGKKPR